MPYVEAGVVDMVSSGHDPWVTLGLEFGAG